MRVVTFKADDDMNRILDEYAKNLGISKSELIRRAIQHYINHVLNGRRVYATRRVRVY